MGSQGPVPLGEKGILQQWAHCGAGLQAWQQQLAFLSW